MGITFIIENLLLGVGLAMDAFSVSIANGLNDADMSRRKVFTIPLTFAVFQALMPLIGWTCVHFFVERFQSFQRYIPYIALFLLLWIGGKMILDGLKPKHALPNNQDKNQKLTFWTLILQGIATSIDALSVGFTLSAYTLLPALGAVALIGIVTFFICFAGVLMGKRIGSKLVGKADVLGGVILIAIGLEMFISSFFH